MKVKTNKVSCSCRIYPGYLMKMNLDRKDNNVRLFQQRLINLGYSIGRCGADGYFGRGTYGAVVKFQREHGLLVDRIVGQRTWKRIMG